MKLKRRTHPKTRFVAFVASTVDGRISLTARAMPDWTSREDWNFLQKSLKDFDAVIVGRNTFRAAEARLRKRNTYVLSRGLSKLHANSGVTFVDPGKTDLKNLLRSHKTVAVLGGGGVYRYMLESKLLDELYVTIEPLVFGRGKPMFAGGTKTAELVLRSVRRLNKKGTLLLHYNITTV